MSKALLEAVDKVMKEMLLAQRDCAYCRQHCETSDHLFIHLVLRHPKPTREPKIINMPEGHATKFKLLDAQSEEIECGVVIV